MKVLRILYYLFIFPFVYIASVIFVVTISTYNYWYEKRFFKKLCSKHGHVWTHYTTNISGFDKKYRRCLRCDKKQYFRPNKGYKDE